MFESEETLTPLAACWVVTATLTLETPVRNSVEVPVPAENPAGKMTLYELPLRRWLAERGVASEAIGNLLANLRVRPTDARKGTARLTLHTTYPVDPVTAMPAGEALETLALESGARFPLRFDLQIPQGTDEPNVLRTLSDLMDALASGRCYLGDEGRDGMGRCQVSGFRAVRYDLTTPEGWSAMADGGVNSRPPENTPEDATGRAIVTAVASEAGISVPASQPYAPRVLSITVDASVTGPLLVRGTPTAPDSPEVAHVSERGIPLLPGSALRDALRQGAHHIVTRLRTVGGTERVDSLFGSSQFTPAEDFQTGKVRILECVLEGGKLARVGRVRIDRFTGGRADDGASEAEVCMGGQARFTVEVMEPDDADTGLLLLVVRDLLDGTLPVGRQGSVGYGVLRGEARVTLPGGRMLEFAGGEFTGLTTVVVDTKFVGPLRGEETEPVTPTGEGEE